MARIAVTPQLPPLTGRHRSPETRTSTSPTGPAGAGGRPGGGVVPDAASPDGAGPDSAVRDKAGPDKPGPDIAPGTETQGNVVPLRPWYRRPGALVAAAVAAVVIGGGTVVAINQLRGQQEQVAQTPEQCVAQAADKRDLVPAKGQGTVTYAQSCNAALLDVTGLSVLPSTETYQLWALAGDQPRSLGVLPDASAGKQQVVTAQPQPGETVVAITAEPAGGSAQPTLPILWQASLT